MSNDSNYISPTHNAFVLNDLPDLNTDIEGVIFSKFFTSRELLLYIKETMNETGYRNLIEDLRANIEGDNNENP